MQFFCIFLQRSFSSACIHTLHFPTPPPPSALKVQSDPWGVPRTTCKAKFLCQNLAFLRQNFIFFLKRMPAYSTCQGQNFPCCGSHWAENQSFLLCVCSNLGGAPCLHSDLHSDIQTIRPSCFATSFQSFVVGNFFLVFICQIVCLVV